jgi:hypothetical protein
VNEQKQQEHADKLRARSGLPHRVPRPRARGKGLKARRPIDSTPGVSACRADGLGTSGLAERRYRRRRAARPHPGTGPGGDRVGHLVRGDHVAIHLARNRVRPSPRRTQPWGGPPGAGQATTCLPRPHIKERSHDNLRYACDSNVFLGVQPSLTSVTLGTF